MLIDTDDIFGKSKEIQWKDHDGISFQQMSLGKFQKVKNWYGKWYEKCLELETP